MIFFSEFLAIPYAFIFFMESLGRTLVGMIVLVELEILIVTFAIYAFSEDRKFIKECERRIAGVKK